MLEGLGVVAAGNLVERFVDLVHENAEFDHAIAHDIGIWGAAGADFFDRVIDDGVEVLALHWDDFEWDFKVFTDLAGVFEVVFPWAFAEELEFVFEPDFEVESVEFVALVFEKP